MKSIIKNITLPALSAMLLAATPLFTACSDDMEVGDTLHPTEAENYTAKLMVSSLSDGAEKMNSTIIITPNDAVVPEDVMEFYVRISQPADRDIKATVAFDAEKSGSKIGADAFKLENAEVTIPKGQQQSAEPVRVKLSKTESMKGLKDSEKSEAVFTVSSVDLPVSSKSSIAWELKGEFNNVKSEGSVAGKTAYDGNSLFCYSYGAGDYITEMTNGDFTDYDYNSDWDGDAWIVGFNDDEAQKISSVAIYPYNYTDYGYGFSVQSYSVYTSNDWETWTKQGKASTTDMPTDIDQPLVAEFYSPVKAKYVKIVVHDNFYGGYWSYFASEIQLFK